jgi:hypothetical protein
MKEYTISIAPIAILYQPNTSKLWFLTKLIRNLTATSDTAKAVSVPTIKTTTSVDVIDIWSMRIAFAPFRSDAPSITGIARKNENSAAAERDTPRTDAPRIVEPERDVPGITERD